MQQPALVDVMQALDTTGDYPRFVTVETNGTQAPRSSFIDYLATEFAVKGEEWFWSVSPKLRTSVERWNDAIKPDVVASYSDLSPHGQLKYVVDGDERTWEEVEKTTTLYRSAGVEFPVYIMPVGGLVEDQELVAGIIADQTIARGYNLAARVHCYLYGNAIGT